MSLFQIKLKNLCFLKMINQLKKKINVHLKVPFCSKNEKTMENYLDAMEDFTGFSIKVTYSLITTKVCSLFPIKDKLSHHHHVIYKEVCSCENTYIGETKRNSVVR